MLPINSCRFILSIEFKKLTPSENLGNQRKQKGEVFKKYADQEFDQTQTQT